MLLYYITDRNSLAGTATQQRTRLLLRIGEAARAGLDYIQLREKDLPACDLERLAREAVRVCRENSATTKLLINGSCDIALASAADGVHLPGSQPDASQVRAQWMRSNNRPPVIAVSAHTIQQLRAAADQGANFAVLAPIFEKPHTSAPGIGIDSLRAACAASTPRAHPEPASQRLAILALGGVTVSNARACLVAGAAGVAGIRLFQNGDLAETVRRLRALEQR
jgi:thiamine-phosphate pyrophosphorylase